MSFIAQPMGLKDFSPFVPVLSYMFVNQIYLLSGKGTVLVAGLQARNNARVVFVGSIEMLSDKFFNAEVSSSSGKKAAKSGNQALAVALASWCFQLSGVLRVKVCKLVFVFVYLPKFMVLVWYSSFKPFRVVFSLFIFKISY